MKKIITLLIFSLVTVSACKENNEVKASENKLAKAEGEYEQAIVLIGDLKNSIRTYHQYFE